MMSENSTGRAQPLVIFLSTRRERNFTEPDHFPARVNPWNADDNRFVFGFAQFKVALSIIAAKADADHIRIVAHVDIDIMRSTVPTIPDQTGDIPGAWISYFCEHQPH